MEEGYPPEMDDVYDLVEKGQAKVFAPDWLMRVEVTNVVVFQKHIKSRAITREEADIELSDFDACAKVVVGIPDRELFPRALELVREQSIALYDAFYVALALREKATLLTCDKLQRKGWEAAKDGRRRVDEPNPSK